MSVVAVGPAETKAVFLYGQAMTVTGHGKTLAAARDLAYRAVDLIDWPEGFCRRDIGWRALGR